MGLVSRGAGLQILGSRCRGECREAQNPPWMHRRRTWRSGRLLHHEEGDGFGRDWEREGMDVGWEEGRRTSQASIIIRRRLISEDLADQ